jgi:choline dehydrogenase-like flavoprotein
MRRVREHRWTYVRLVGLLLVAPLMEVAAEDESPESSESHPLESHVGGVPSEDEHVEALVVGSGAGGAPVAMQLAESGVETAVVEKGDLVEATSVSDALESHYLQQGLFGVARGTPVLVMAGETVGGTTSINCGTSLRPRDECLKGWDRRLGTDFADGGLEPWIERAEQFWNVHVPPDELRSRSARAMARGFDALGRDDYYGLPRSVDGCRGSGRCMFGCPTGAKQGTDRAFLPRFVEAGGELVASWRATRIREVDRGVEVRLERDGEVREWTCDRLILAAGALGTPELIRRNRLGSHWPRAGEGFKTHPAAKVFGWMPDLDPSGERPGIPQGLGYRPPERPRLGMEGAEVPKAAAGPMIAAGGDRFRWWYDRYDELVGYGAMVRDRNTGSLRPFLGQPLLSYEMHPDDAADLVAGMKLIGRAMFEAGAERVMLPVPGRTSEFESADALERLQPGDVAPDQLMTSGFHPQGTAGMGRVVDTDLRLRGSERIYVADASVLPDSPGVNPQVTIAALSLRLGEQLAGE